MRFSNTLSVLLYLLAIALFAESSPIHERALEERKLKLSLPKLSLPKLSLPKLSLPKPAAPKVAAPKVKPAAPKAAPPPAAPPAKPKAAAPPAEVAPPPPPKAVSSPAKSAAACPIGKKPATKTGGKIKGRTEEAECDDTSKIDADTCAEVTNCNQCITTPTTSGKCGFTFDTGKCVPSNAPEVGTLATSSKQCAQIATQQATSSVSPEQVIVNQVAASLVTKIFPHVLGTDGSKSTSGRHLLSIWTQANPSSKVIESNAQTGIVSFKNGEDKKTVWNDVASGSTAVYSQADVKALCNTAMAHAINANTKTTGILNQIKSAGAPAAAPVKGKGKKAKAAPSAAELQKQLAPLPGLFNGFITLNPTIGKQQCIVASTASCFPLSLGVVSGTEGGPCKGDEADVSD